MGKEINHLEEVAIKAIDGCCPVVINEEYYYIRKQLFDVFEAGYKQAIADTIDWLSEIDNGTTITNIKAFIDAFKRDMVE